MSLTIAVDAMGGDHGPKSTMPAILSQARHFPDIDFQVFGHKKYCLIDEVILDDCPSNMTFYHVDDWIGMDQVPTQALRHGRSSSMAKSIQSVKAGEAQACITAGNTGALVALSRHILGIYKSIDRPALCKVMPTILGRSYMLDLGATINCSAEQLVQFATLGAALFCQHNKRSSKTSKSKDSQYLKSNIPTPRVRLLNIGSEHFKGMEPIRLAAETLSSMPNIDYQGYIEGDAIYRGETDIIVCDGFVGNIALKSSEGVANFMLQSLKSGFQKLDNKEAEKRDEWLSTFKQWQQQCDPARYNGAQLLGVKGIVVKSHGCVSEHAFSQAISMLIDTLLADALLVDTRQHYSDNYFDEMLGHTSLR